MARDQRRLAAIVSADVAGYSRLMGRDESGTLIALKAHRRELIDPKIAEYGGRIVKTTGDGLLLEFPSVVDAVRCAVDMQRGMAARNVDVAADRKIIKWTRSLAKSKSRVQSKATRTFFSSRGSLPR